MTDLFGYTAPRAPFVDIRNQRDSVSEEKAILCRQLNELVRKVPDSIRGASVNKTREWMHVRERCQKVLQNKRSSRTELQSAVNTMREFDKATA